MKIAVLHLQDEFNEADRAAVEAVKKELQDALDADSSVAVILPKHVAIEVLSYDEIEDEEADLSGDGGDIEE